MFQKSRKSCFVTIIHPLFIFKRSKFFYIILWCVMDVCIMDEDVRLWISFHVSDFQKWNFSKCTSFELTVYTCLKIMARWKTWFIATLQCITILREFALKIINYHKWIFLSFDFYSVNIILYIYMNNIYSLCIYLKYQNSFNPKY